MDFVSHPDRLIRHQVRRMQQSKAIAFELRSSHSPLAEEDAQLLVLCVENPLLNHTDSIRMGVSQVRKTGNRSRVVL